MPRAAFRSSSRLLGRTSRLLDHSHLGYPACLIPNLRLYCTATFTSLGFRSQHYLSDRTRVDWYSSEATAPPVCTPSTNVPSFSPYTAFTCNASRFSRFQSGYSHNCGTLYHSTPVLITQLVTYLPFSPRFLHATRPAHTRSHQAYTQNAKLTRTTASFPHHVLGLHDPRHA
jgi:hypothetical protein